MRSLVTLAVVIGIAVAGCGNRQGSQVGKPGALPQAARTAVGKNDASLVNLKHLAAALFMYYADYDEVLPAMKDVTTAKKLLGPYLKSDASWVNPQTRETYGVNPSLGNKKTASFANPAQIVAFYEVAPARDGTRGVAFVAGNVARVDESQWQQLKSASGIP